ncbi:MAG: AsmA family protein [Alphaproteobacteria bacterium]
MLSQKINIPVNLRFVAVLTLGFLFLVGIALVIQGQIDTNTYRSELKRIIKERTGRDVYIRGDVSVMLLPVPTVYIAGIELRDINDGKPIPAVTVELAHLTPTLSTIFSDTPQMSSIVLERPVLEINRGENNQIEWDWLKKELDLFAKQGSDIENLSVEIIDGTMIYRNAVDNRSVSVGKITLSGNLGAIARITGSMQISDRNVFFDLTKDADAGTGDLPVMIQLYADEKNIIKLEGKVNFSAELPKIAAKLTVDIEDVFPWLVPAQEKKQSIFNQLSGEDSQENKKSVLPIQFSGDWSQQGNKFDISNIVWNGLQSTGTGTLVADFSESSSVDVQMKFASLDYLQWKSLLQIIMQQLYAAGERQFQLDAEVSKNPIPEDIDISFDMTAEKLVMALQTWENVRINMDVADGALTINQFQISLPGESNLGLFGVVSQNATTTAMRFEGNIETEGKSLRKVLSIFDESVADLPDLGAEDFYLRSNIYLSHDQIRLSESDVKVGDLKLGGGLVVYYDSNNPRVEADVKLQSINFDYFRNLWRERQKDAKPKDFFLKIDQNMNWGWLRNLQTTVDLKIQVEKFTFLDREGDNAYLRLFARQNELGIQNVRFYYPEDVTEANITLDVAGEKPFLNVLVNTAELNTAYFEKAVAERAVKPDVNRESAPQNNAEPQTNVEIIPQSQNIILLAQADVQDPVPPTVGDSKPKEIPLAEEEVTAAIEAQQNSANAETAQEKAPKVWPEELIDMTWMDGFNGVFDISAGKLLHNDLVVDRVKTRFKLDNSQVTIQSLSFAYWQGRCEVTGTLLGGKVPGISLGFTLFNIEMKDFLGDVLNVHNINGKLSVSGSFSASGVNYKSWIAQSEGKMLITGRGVNVQKLNLQGVVDTVRVSRTAADVLNNVNRVLTTDATEMSIDGPINIKNGVLRSPAISLKSGATTGTMNGELKILPWTLDLATLFQFPTLTAETIPTLLVQLNGSIDGPVLTTDTASLEAFVVKSIEQK